MFIYENWEKFCKELNNEDIHSVTSDCLLKENKDKEKFLVLKHDVETNPSKALRFAEIENKYSHKGSYYVQGYLLHNKNNIEILRKIKGLGHEVSYHHDVMDSNKGDIEKARLEFLNYTKLFEKHDFTVNTVCQHGNPVIERNGYTSNRDFFRNASIRDEFSHIAEMMVNFKEKMGINYEYISDAGYGWKVIFDPENNDIINSTDKDIVIEDFEELVKYIKEKKHIVVSTHPHRWHSNRYNALLNDIVFRSIKFTAKLLLKIPGMEKIMGKFYFLAKRI